ncbi:MAG: tRNA lysidine(34) synthetase TilS [Pseudomonadota bacterium]|uniref:tRNA(Ile)-lysidine synthase n=1 Tax=Candidatus Desulfatibia profunda TaxID=2841695 RepID=A0A8J6NNM5_9BACT|nr:tRNA lysidine(34) synthetase TilS [Candidatus Desulfatibia profunda]MBL7180738.1 tRNA lysidine(34) synthetase TilS [Desulfobacterales bacterium]
MPASRKGYKNKVFRTVEKTVAAHEMFKPQDSVLVGVSGGPDSVALLHALITLASGLSLKLGVAHLNHGLRLQASDDDAIFVASLADRFDLPFYVHKVDVRKYQHDNRLSLEEAGRRVRYAFLTDLAAKGRFDKIALGHHADDNAELVLMNLFRGSGPLGISGIPPVRGVKIVRPLIKLRRSDILEYLKLNGLTYVSDRTNLDLKHLRNRVRHQLIPLLKTSYNPKIIETLNRLASILSAEEEWMEDVLRPILDAAILNAGPKTVTLSVSKLDGVHIAALRRIIRNAVERIKGDLRRITFAHVDAVIRLLESPQPFGNLDLPDRVRVRRMQGVLLISKEQKALRDLDIKPDQDETFTFEYSINKPGTLFIKELNAQIKFSETRVEHLSDFSHAGHLTGFFDMNRLGFPLIVRNVRPGDRFKPLGMTGTQKLKDFFINQKVPRTERAKCPVLLSRGKIIWVVGHRIDESVKVMPATGKVLKGELRLA